MVKSMSDDLKKIAEDMMKEIMKKLNTSKESNKDWGKTINIVFSDIDVGYSVKYAMDGSVECKKETVDDAIVNMNVAVEDLKKVLEGEMSGMDAYNNGLFQVEGDLMSLQKLMPALMPGGL
jgi:putative sterol carrier protein